MTSGWISPTIHIYAPDAETVSIGRRECLDCKRNSYFTAIFTEYFGWDTTCLNCGRSWCDGEWMPLDFVPQSRQRSKDDAKKRWRRNRERISQGTN